MPKYYNNIKGYFVVRGNTFHEDRYYILSLLNLRKPVILQLACSSAYLAKRYIMLKTNPIFHEVITGKQALEKNIPLTKKKYLDKGKQPEKYEYPKGSDWRKKKQHRTKFRQIMRNYFSSSLNLKQYTVKYRQDIYTTFDFSTLRAFNTLAKRSGMKWNHFIKAVDNTPQPITKQMIFLKSIHINIVIINQFNKQNHVSRVKYLPSGKPLSKQQSALFSVQKPKPKRLVF